MKRKNYNLMRMLMVFAIIVGGLSSSMAQTARVEMPTDLDGYQGVRMSSNGRYIIGYFGPTDWVTFSCLWDRVANKSVTIGDFHDDLSLTNPCSAEDVSNDGIVVGRYAAKDIIKGKNIMTGGWWKDGKWYALPGDPENPVSKTGFGTDAKGITADGQYIGGSIRIPNPQGVMPTYKLIPAVWEKSGDTYVLHKMHKISEKSVQGAMVYNISDNGKTVCGWEANEFNQWGAAIWFEDGTSVVQPTQKGGMGGLMGLNDAGNVAVGYVNAAAGDGIIVNSDGTTKSMVGLLTDISEAGVVLSTGGIWSEDMGSWGITMYLKKFWGIEFEGGYGVSAAMSISRDGKFIGGSAKGPKGEVPFIAVLEGFPLPIEPVKVNTALTVNGKNVIVTWNKPPFNGYNPIGYNVFRGATKMNAEILTELTFTDNSPVLGKNDYTVTAIYKYDATTQKESVKSEVSSIEFIAENGCFSPKKIQTEIVYNKSVTLTWGLPLPNYVSSETKADDVEGLLGYNVYKNDVKQNVSGPITENSFKEDITEPGDYTYTVTALFEGGCESNKSMPKTITINPLGICNIPKNLKIELIRNNAQLTWNKPSATPPHKLVGYNLYRDGVKLNSELLTNTSYTDTELALGEYSYQLDAFYDNSCVSDKSAPTVARIGGVNTVVPPSNFSLNVDSNTQATLSWNAPQLGNYETLRWYNGGIEFMAGQEDGGTMYVGAKWDATDLKNFYDYTLTEVEFYSVVNTPHTFYIYVDGKKVAEQNMATVNPKSFNVLKLDSPVLVEKGKELMVGYKVSNKDKTDCTIGADKKKSAVGKGDLISYDGITWESLWEKENTALTWAITIRLSPYSVAPSRAMPEQTSEAFTHGKVAVISLGEAKSMPTSVFVNKEVTGYNVYEGDTKLNASPITETTYKATIDNSSDKCYSVEALFTNNRTSAKTNQECIYGECRVASGLEATNNESNIDLTWAAPSDKKAENVELKYYHEAADVGSMKFNQVYQFYAYIQMTALDMMNYSNLKLKSINALILEECKVSMIVMQAGKIILDKAVTAADINFGEYTTFAIPDGGMDIDMTKDIFIGFKIRVDANKFSLGLDAGPANNYRGDIISPDGINNLSPLSMTANVNSNWNISANFEQAVPFGEAILGYNIYRDGKKINSSEINTLTYSDATVVPDSKYEYYVTTLWNTGCESKASNKVTVSTKPDGLEDVNASDITIFPNPANNKVNIKGEYSSLRMYNSAGLIVLDQNEKSDHVDISSLQRGIYIIELSNGTEVINRTKLVVTK